MGAPVLLEVADQRGAEVADRLLAAVDRHVLAEDVERLLADPQRAPVGDAADRAGAGRGRARACARSPRPSRPAATISSASSSGASSRPERIAWRARRSPTKRGSRRFAAPGMIPSLRAGSVQRQCRARRGCGRRSAAAGSRRRSRTSPPRRSTASRPRGSLQPAVDLVDEAEVADREEQVGDLAAVEVGEVQAGAEDAPAGVARVLDDAAAQHADLDLRVEQDEVDRRLQRAGRRVVLGVEVARVAQLDGADVAAAARRCAVPRSTRPVALEARRGARARAASGAASRRSGGGRVSGSASTWPSSCALRDLVALLVLLQAARARGSTCSRVGVRPGTRSAAA